MVRVGEFLCGDKILQVSMENLIPRVAMGWLT